MKSVLLPTIFALVLVMPAAAQTTTPDSTLTPLAPLPDVAKPMPRLGRSAKVPAPGKPDALPKPSKEELAEQRKLAHDMRICIGC